MRNIINTISVLSLITSTLMFSGAVYSQASNIPKRDTTENNKIEIQTHQERQRLEYVRELQGKNEQERISIIKGEHELTVYEKYLATEFRLNEKDFKKYQKDASLEKQITCCQSDLKYRHVLVR